MQTFTIIINNRQLNSPYVYDNDFNIYYRLQQHPHNTPESILILNPNVIFPDLYDDTEIKIVPNN